MNESDIRQRKIHDLFNDNIYLKDYENQEIKEICPDFLTHFNNEEQEAFNKLGKTFKSYNEIIQLRNNFLYDSKLDQYILRKKDKIKYKIFLFYEENSNRKNIYEEKFSDYSFIKYMDKIFSFIPEIYEYNYENIQIIDNIPFKYFDVVKKGKEKFIINFSCKLVEEVYIDIYRTLILNCSFHEIKNITEGSVAYDSIFKYSVVFKLKEKLNNGSFNLFNYFSISKNLNVKKFILDKTEIIHNLIFKVQKLEEKFQYIINQEVFNGKLVDFIIIRFINSIPYVYGFQVLAFKNEIYKIEDVQKLYESMKKLLEKYFMISFNKYYMFFGYIFDFTQINSDKYLIMLNDCLKENIKYCFYDHYSYEFKDEKGNKIENIKNIVTTVFETNKKIYNSSTLDDFVFKFKQIDIEEEKIKDDYGLLNDNQKRSLLKIIKNRFGINAEYKFIKKGTIDNFIIDKLNFYIIVLDNLIPLVVFFKKMACYILYYDGNIEESDQGKFNDELYIYKIFYT